MHNNTQFGFNEQRLGTLLHDLEGRRNVGCVLKELCTLRIPETTARNYKVVDKVKPFESVPVLNQFVATIVQKNKRMSEINRIRRLRSTVKRAKKAKIFFIVNNKVMIPRIKTVMIDGESVADIQNPVNDAPSGKKFPLKFGPGLHHSSLSPFWLIHSRNMSPHPLLFSNAPRGVSIPTTSAVSATAKTQELRGIPYIRDLYERVVRETEELSQIENPTIDQVLEEMSMLNPNFHFRK